MAVRADLAMDVPDLTEPVHRDLKTANVMVERTESGKCQPFVLDFGLARDVDSGQPIAGEVASTPAFMAPEQAHGECVDKRTDV